MEFCTLAEIAQHNARRREQLVSLVVSASPDLRAWRPAPEKWSIQEHLEHLALAAGWFATRSGGDRQAVPGTRGRGAPGSLHLGHMRANAEAWATRDQVQRA
jgi:uncharacterized damage-inducible protein DinB